MHGMYGGEGRGKTRAHHDETDHGDDGHEDARSFTQGERVELHKWLRGIEREERVQVRNAEQEKYGGQEAQDAGGDRAREDPFAGNDAVTSLSLDKRVELQGFFTQSWLDSLRVFRLFGDVARGVKAGQCTCCEKAWEYQYQNRFSSVRFEK